MYNFNVYGAQMIVVILYAVDKHLVSLLKKKERERMNEILENRQNHAPGKLYLYTITSIIIIICIQ